MSSTVVLSTLVGACLVVLTSSQCATTNNANCGSWVTNGFCNNGAYTTAQKQAYCPNSCPVGCAGSPTTTVIPTTDQNTHCAAWAGNNANPFCLNTMTAAQKRQYCASTCAFEISPNADCAVYTLTNNVLARLTPTNRTSNPGTAVAITLAAGSTVARTYTGATCTLSLYTEASTAVTVGTTTAAETKAGTAGMYQTVTTATTAQSYSCACT
ncbi:hypothetical protein PRIPAC_98010 [Pristionchus pacificus]|uniref:ShK domain-containing protein n=1 Tax=Pristionchus pacificus TaxID=54126 RepID=A0A2A6CH95_PRIPA|nr:hypothetical protein PRIPAC_98010 [Pristionchus pacificus]|eukprot:PDM77466.1 ShK domain-containing protein [Pristionchus pacificus]